MINSIINIYPKTIRELLVYININIDKKCVIIAGGTGLLVNYNNNLVDIELLIHIENINSLKKIIDDKNNLFIGSSVKLIEISKNNIVKLFFPELLNVIFNLASPQIRNMGTIGGNILLRRKCVFYNQSYFLKSSFDFCLRKNSSFCNILKNYKKCLSNNYGDLICVLAILKSKVDIIEIIKISNNTELLFKKKTFFIIDFIKKKNENLINYIILRIKIPKYFFINYKRIVGFSKFKLRNSTDFSIFSVVVSFILSENFNILKCEIAINGLFFFPKIFNIDKAINLKLNNYTIFIIAKVLKNKCKFVKNKFLNSYWYTNILEEFVKKACYNAIKKL